MSDTVLLGETVVFDDYGAPRRSRAHPAFWTSTALLVPAACLLVPLVLWPVTRTAVAALTDPVALWRTAGDELGPFLRTIAWAVAMPVLVTVLGLALAVAFRRAPLRTLVMLALVAPIGLPMVVTGVIFRILYDPDANRGAVTALLEALGWSRAPTWLGPDLITLALMSAFVWAWVGLAFVVFHTALDRVPTELVDAVRNLGGGSRDLVRDVYWPQLRRTVTMVLALVSLATVRSFDLILLMAPGSSVDASSVLAVRLWQGMGTLVEADETLGGLWLLVVAVVVLLAGWSRQAWPASVEAAPPAASEGRGDEAGWWQRLVGAPRPAPDATKRQRQGGAIAHPPPQRKTPRLLRRMRTAARAVLPVSVTVAWMIPLLALVMVSLHPSRQAATAGWWSELSTLGIGPYRTALSGPLGGSLVLTGLLALAVTSVVLPLALTAAHALAWIERPWGTVASSILLAAAVVPVLVIVRPVTEVLDLVPLLPPVARLALVHMALGLPFAILVLRNALSDVPAADVRRARLQAGGPSTLRVELRVLRRLWRTVEPAAIAVFVLEFVQVWNDFVVGLTFGGPGVVSDAAPDAAPLSVLLYGQSRQFVASATSLSTSAVLASLVPVALVLVFHRRVVAGLTQATVS